MRLDVKKEINQVIQDKSLTKDEKIRRIKDLYNSSNNGVTGADTKDGGGSGNASGQQNGASGNSDDQNGNGQGSGQNGQQGKNGNQQGQGGQQSGQQGQNGNQNGQQGKNGNQQGSNQNNGGVHNVSHNSLKNQVGQNGQGNGQNGNQQNNQNGQNGSSNGSNGQQGNQNGNQQGQGSGSQQGSQQGGQQSGQQGSSNSQQGGQQSQNGQQGQGNQQGGQQSSQNGSQSSQNNQNGQGSQQSQQTEVDEYTIGYELGKKYAEEMYLHRGLKPIMGDIFELPDLDPMKIVESVNESIEDEISKLLDDNSLDDDEKTSKIHDLFRGTSVKGNANQEEPKEKYIPDNEIIMRNGAADYDGGFVGNHVIDKNIGDEIRKEAGVTPKDPDWGLSDDEDAMIREAFPIIDDIFKSFPQDDKEIVSQLDTYKNKIQGRIRKSREGIIDWKKALEEFVSERSRTYTQGPLRKNVYQRTGIGLKHRIPSYNDYNKCVVYIDTSGSVNNSQTQLIPIMAGEIGKIMQDCHFNTVDIHLFDDVVYNEHYDVDSYTVQDEDWGIEGADDGGGTNIHEVYKHIIKNYMNGDELNYNINAIIIITDVSGMQYSGNIKPFVSKLGEDVLRKMLYVIYNDYNGMYMKEVSEEMDKLVSKYSQHYEIPVEAFRKQILDESMNINQKRLNMNEALGGLKKIQAKQQAAQVVQSQRSEEERKERLRKAELQGARQLGRLEEVLPELIANIEKFFPNCRAVKEYTAVMVANNTYYITDDAQVILHLDIDKDNIDNLCNACEVMNIVQLLGNVVLKGARTFKGFPPGFPKEIGGDFIMFNLPSLRNFDNAPEAVAGRVSINVCYPMSKHIMKNAQNEYIHSIKGTLTPIGDLEGENKPKSVFTMTKRNESVEEIIKQRIALGESYINEMALPHKLSSVFPRRSKPQAGSKITDDDYIASTELYKRNRNVFFDVIDPILNVGWGDIKDDDITVISDVSQIRLAARDSKYFEKNKDNVDQLGYAGIRLFTTSDDVISAVYAQTKKNSKPVMIFLNDGEGNPITDPAKIKQEVDNRYDIFKQTYKYLQNVGVDVANLPEKFSKTSGKGENATVEAAGLHVLYYLLCILNGSSGAIEYKFKPSELISDKYKDGAADNKEIFDKILQSIISNYRMYDDSVKAYTKAGRVTINFNQRDKNQPNSKVNFNVAFLNSYNAPLNVFDYFSDNFIKAMLIGSSLRGVDDAPRFDIDTIVDADREELLDMINQVKDVELIKTSLKSMSFKGKNMDDANYDHANPFDVLMMFPDKCEKEYDIRVDVNDEALKLVGKKVMRDIYKAGMYNDIKNYDYDRHTGERTRNDIKGTSSLKKATSANELFDQLNGVVEYVLINKDIFNDVKDALKKAVDNYTANHSWYSNKAITAKIDESVTVIYNYANLIKSKILNNEELVEEKKDVISTMIATLNDIVDRIEKILKLSNPDDYQDVIEEGNQLIKSATRFAEEYKILAGESDEAAKIAAKKMKKLGERNRNKKAAAEPQAEPAKNDYDTSKFEMVVDNMTDNIAPANAVVKGIDFSKASEDAIDHFSSKDDMVRRIENQLNRVAGIANAIRSNGATDWMKGTEKLIREVDEILASIVHSNDVETITDFLVDLDGACRAVAKATKGFAPGQTYKSTGAAIA